MQSCQVKLHYEEIMTMTSLKNNHGMKPVGYRVINTISLVYWKSKKISKYKTTIIKSWSKATEVYVKIKRKEQKKGRALCQ
jgi:hypothetical protein